jgi:hypothetical protein
MRHIEDPHMLGVTVQNSVATVTWRPGLVYPLILAYLQILLLVIYSENKITADYAQK